MLNSSITEGKVSGERVLLDSGTNPCQDLSKCPYNYKNIMPDYVEGAPVVITDGLTEFMEINLDIYLDKVYEDMPPSKLDSVEVFSGVAGRALMWMRLYDRTGNSSYLSTAQAYMDTSLAHVNSITNDYVGFLWGKTGVYSVAAVLATIQGDNDLATSMIQQVQRLFDLAKDDSFAKYDDYDSGRAGLLFAAKFLQTFYDEQNKDGHATDVITRSSIVAVANATVQRGKALSRDPAYLEWISPNDGGKWLGMSHGSAGVLSQLLDVPELLQEGSETRELIKGTLDHIVSEQFPSGNFPSEYYAEDDDVLVQW